MTFFSFILQCNCRYTRIINLRNNLDKNINKTNPLIKIKLLHKFSSHSKQSQLLLLFFYIFCYINTRVFYTQHNAILMWIKMVFCLKFKRVEFQLENNIIRVFYVETNVYQIASFINKSSLRHHIAYEDNAHFECLCCMKSINLQRMIVVLANFQTSGKFLSVRLCMSD